MKILKKTMAFVLIMMLSLTILSACTNKDNGKMRDITSMELVADMGLGWNLGNTLDATPNETSWGNPPASEDLIKQLKKDGIDSIRVPVTWKDHHGSAPDYEIDEQWMDRVQEVVDYVVDNGMYAILNLHHDEWIMDASKDYDKVLERYKALWSQIADRFKGYSDYLIFESMNEIGFEDLQHGEKPTQEAYDILNKLNDEFVTLIRSTGGNNPERHLLIAGYFTDIARSVEGSVIPDDDRTILSLHYYTPWRFCVNGVEEDNSTAFWGSDNDIAELKRLFTMVETTFIEKGVPVILGEYGVNPRADKDSRIFWIEYVTKTSYDMGIAPFFWDNGEEVDRATNKWRTEGLIDAMNRATSGKDYEVEKP